jgi:hypothetical protein
LGERDGALPQLKLHACCIHQQSRQDVAHFTQGGAKEIGEHIPDDADLIAGWSVWFVRKKGKN